jgi:hypothetical protein
MISHGERPTTNHYYHEQNDNEGENKNKNKHQARKKKNDYFCDIWDSYSPLRTSVFHDCMKCIPMLYFA